MDSYVTPNPDEIEVLVSDLSSDDRLSRAEAARRLCNLGVPAKEYIPLLLNLVDDPWYQVRIQVARTIIHFDLTVEETSAILSRLLADPEESVRLYAREAARVAAER